MAPLRLRRISVQCQNIKKQQHFMWGKTDTVFTIKSMIEKKTGTPSRQQVLTWQGAVAPLADDRPLRSYNLKDEANISMTVCDERLDTFQCFVKLPNGKTMTMHLVSDDSVLHIKEMIHTETGIPRAMMYITTGRYLLQDLRCLSDYNIGSASNMTVHLRLHGGSGAEWSTEELNTRIDELSNRVDEIGEVFVTDNYVDMKDLELHGRIDELTDTIDEHRDNMLASYSSLSTRLTVKGSELQDLTQHVLQHDTMIETLVSGKHLSSALASCSSGSQDAMAIAAIRSAENLAVTVAHAQGAAALATSEVHTMKRIMELFETDQNDATAKQSAQEDTITDLRHQVYSLTDTLHDLIRRVDNMERNVRATHGRGTAEWVVPGGPPWRSDWATYGAATAKHNRPRVGTPRRRAALHQDARRQHDHHRRHERQRLGGHPQDHDPPEIALDLHPERGLLLDLPRQAPHERGHPWALPHHGRRHGVDGASPQRRHDRGSRGVRKR